MKKKAQWDVPGQDKFLMIYATLILRSLCVKLFSGKAWPAGQNVFEEEPRDDE